MQKKKSIFYVISSNINNFLKNAWLRIKQRCKFILNKLFIIFICLFIALCGQVVVILLQDWKEFKSPYPIMVEYYRIRYFGSYRAWMINWTGVKNEHFCRHLKLNWKIFYLFFILRLAIS